MLGIDIVRVERVRRLLEGSAAARARVFSAAEIVYCESKGRKCFQHYAARFAAKEATLKALGIGWRGDIGFDEIALLPGYLGRPILHLPDRLQDRLRECALDGVVSLSHDRDYACAAVLFRNAETAGGSR